jgi:hypothetical protein
LALAFATDTRNIFQALNLVLFNALKKKETIADDESDDNSINDQMTTLIQASE